MSVRRDRLSMDGDGHSVQSDRQLPMMPRAPSIKIDGSGKFTITGQLSETSMTGVMNTLVTAVTAAMTVAPPDDQARYQP